VAAENAKIRWNREDHAYIEEAQRFTFKLLGKHVKQLAFFDHHPNLPQLRISSLINTAAPARAALLERDNQGLAFSNSSRSGGFENTEKRSRLHRVL
jgi:hypothetical protein